MSRNFLTAVVLLFSLVAPLVALDLEEAKEAVDRYGKYDENLYYLTVAKSSKAIDSLGRAFEIKKRLIINELANELANSDQLDQLEGEILSHIAKKDAQVWTDEFAEDLQTALTVRGVETNTLRIRASRSYREKSFEERLKRAKEKISGTASLVNHLYFEADDYNTVAKGLTTKASSFQGQKLKILSRGELAFTFDDGPHLGGRTTTVLDALRDNGFKATFFQLGSSISSNSTCRAIMRRIAAEGHDVGVHGWYHATKSGKPFTTMKKASIRSDLTRAKEVLTKGYGFAPCTFRAPYGEFRNSDFDILRSLGLTYVGWDIDTNDWRKKTPSQLAQETIRLIENKGKGIVLMHDVQQRTAAAIPQILRTLRSKGYRLVTIREKLGLGTSQTGNQVANSYPQHNPKPVPQFSSDMNYKRKGVVTVNTTLNVRRGPSVDHGKIGSVAAGYEVTITNDHPGWYGIEYNGTTGWVSADYVRLLTREGTVNVNTTLNVRSGPSTSNGKLGKLSRGDYVTILGEKSNWYAIDFNGTTGWVSADYISLYM